MKITIEEINQILSKVNSESTLEPYNRGLTKKEADIIFFHFKNLKESFYSEFTPEEDLEAIEDILKLENNQQFLYEFIKATIKIRNGVHDQLKIIKGNLFNYLALYCYNSLLKEFIIRFDKTGKLQDINEGSHEKEITERTKWLLSHVQPRIHSNIVNWLKNPNRDTITLENEILNTITFYDSPKNSIEG